MERSTEKEGFNGLMDPIMMENFIKTFCRVKVSITGMMARYTLEQ